MKYKYRIIKRKDYFGYQLQRRLKRYFKFMENRGRWEYLESNSLIEELEKKMRYDIEQEDLPEIQIIKEFD